MVDEKASADFSPGMDFDSGQETADMGDKTR
jgi:hypothetical protein